MLDLIGKLAGELKFSEYQINNAVTLLFDEECTIPFVARYRKEKTGSLDEVDLRTIRDRYAYLKELEDTKAKYLRVVEMHCQQKPELKGKWPELQQRFASCETKQELEDLYLPFKPKRRTRAQVAREQGLEPLLNKILENAASLTDLSGLAAEYITAADADVEPRLVVKSAEQALAGAGDILAERIAETAELRAQVREIGFQTGVLVSKKIDEPQKTEADLEKQQKSRKKKKNPAAKFENYFDFREPVGEAVSHRVMAIRRGEAEKILRVSIEVDAEQILSALKAGVLDENATEAVRTWQGQVVEDAWKRLLSPSLETEIRLQLKTRAEEEAIRVFSDNLTNLLLLPPIPGQTTMGVDPGLRTGSKLAVVSDTGKLLDHATIYPDPQGKDNAKTKEARATLHDLITKHQVRYLAIGNGTGSREIGRVVAAVIKAGNLKDIKRLVVNEAGASVYSTDEIAREEFPDLDPTIRSAVSIARRLQDPLAELVKIDPRSIGVGQYQHDVNPTRLNRKLGEVVESCVNKVGVNVNTASWSLLGYVSGIGRSLAKNIVQARDEKGKFGSRNALKEINGFGPKAYEQAAGFLRVPESDNPLDNSGVHPESYELVEKIISDQKRSLQDLIGKKELVEAIALEGYVTDTIGMPTLQDIAGELIKPGRDPREDGTRLTFSDEVSEVEDLKPGMSLPGTVTNVTNFGAFVDIGVHQDGLVHISELADQFVDDPARVVSVGQVLKVRVLEVDLQRRRISLSCRSSQPRPKQQTDSRGAGRPERPASGQNRKQRPPHQDSPRGDRRPRRGKKSHGDRPQKPSYTVDDLLAKFNTRS